MRRITGSLFQSLDGVIQAPGGPEEDQTGFAHGGWTFPYFDASLAGPMGRLLGGAYELLLGRRTYEIFAAYWPHNADQPIGATFNAIRKHVVTASDAALGWNNSRRLAGDPVAAITRLKESEGPDLLIQGSSALYPALLPAGLIDRIVLITFPVMLGRGKRWYADDPSTARTWTLVEQSLSPKGVHFAAFARDGAVQTGSFASKPPERGRTGAPRAPGGGSLVDRRRSRALETVARGGGLLRELPAPACRVSASVPGPVRPRAGSFVVGPRAGVPVRPLGGRAAAGLACCQADAACRSPRDRDGESIADDPPPPCP